MELRFERLDGEICHIYILFRFRLLNCFRLTRSMLRKFIEILDALSRKRNFHFLIFDRLIFDFYCLSISKRQGSILWYRFYKQNDIYQPNDACFSLLPFFFYEQGQRLDHTTVNA